MSEKKYFWQSKWVFILAAIWSAAGLWNLWRFPYQVYDYGGGAFIAAYLIILFLMWLGLLIWEIAFGQKTQKWAPEAFGQVSVYLKWLWWFSIFIGAIILTYYAVVIWWGIDYLWYSLHSLVSWVPLPWIENSEAFFFNKVLWISQSIKNWWNLSIPVFLWTIIVWILIYLFTFRSTKSVWKVVLITATLPFLTLLLLAIRGITLPGAMEGLKYLFSFDVWKFLSFETWKAAASQIFFTLSLAMGIMIAYWALKKPNSEIVRSTIIVALWNTLVSFLSAIAVFSTLWYLAYVQNVPVNKVVTWWPGLVFVVLPKTIALMPILQSFFAVIFFLTVFLLAIDSAMSLIEAVSVAVRDKIKSLSVEIITLIVSIILGVGSLLYVFWNWLYILDIVDHFVTSWWMLFVGILEALVFIWIWFEWNFWDFIDSFNECKLRFVINKYLFLFSWIFAIAILSYLLWTNISKGIKYENYDIYYLKIFGILPLIVVLIVSILINFVDLIKNKK